MPQCFQIWQVSAKYCTFLDFLAHCWVIYHSCTCELRIYVLITSPTGYSLHIMYLPYEFNIFQLETAPPLRDQIIIDRATQNSVQNRFDNLKKEASDIEVRNQQLKDALDNVIRLQARSEKVFCLPFFKA